MCLQVILQNHARQLLSYKRFIWSNDMFLAVDKPKGISSFDVIRILKRQFPKKTKIGHSGTLDPIETGLLIVAVDKNTKRLWEFLWADKTYIATIDLSKKSDTRDAEYRETYEELDPIKLTIPTLEQIQTILNTLIPSASLPLPPFSAKKINGQKRYDLARKGEQEIVRQDMKINSYTITEYNFPEIKIQIEVWSGTYIRSIAYRLGTQLHTGGILTQLQRTQIKGIHLTKGTEQKDGLCYSIIEVPETQSK